MSRLHGADRKALVVGYRAISELLRVSGAEEAAGVLIRVVTDLGGRLVPARLADDDALPLDLSCGHGEPLLPAAPPGTRARLRLATLLPALLEDARFAVARAQHLNRLAEQVDNDPLTGLLNRRAVERLLPRLAPGDSVLVIDLDRFKALNDAHGHAAGDGVLTAFSRLLREHGRAEDRYSRLGGEEFLGIFPATAVTDVARGVQRLRVAWTHVAPLPVTFSAGIAAVTSSGGPAAVAEADAAMYAAKRAGRDRTVIASTGEVPYVPRQSPHDDASSPARSAVPTLLRHMAAFDVASATELVHRLLDQGVGVPEVTIELLGAAQVEVGRRWQSGTWSVADEHGATAVADAALAAVTAYADSTGRGANALHVVVACPDGEWHQMPARMLAALLADAGFRPSLLGPSLPAHDLQRALARERPAALALSCTVATNLPAAQASIHSAHEVGVPVLVGGRGFGPDEVRATAVGADGWARSVADATALISRWQSSPPALRSARRETLEEPLSAALTEPVLREVLAGIAAELPVMAGFSEAQLDATRKDVRHIVRCLDVALAIGDERIFTEFTDWLADVLAGRALPAESLVAGYRAIDEALGELSDHARRLLRQTLRHLETVSL